MKLFCLTVSAMFLLCSCVNTKKTSAVWMVKNQSYFQRKNGGIDDPHDSIFQKHLTRGARGSITTPALPSDVLTITFAENVEGKSKTDSQRLATPDDPPNPFYFPGPIKPKVANNRTFPGQKFKYVDIRHTLQALTIPLKLRPGMRDTIKSTASAAFNVGFAYAYKFTFNTLRKFYWNNNGSATPLSSQINSVSLSAGPFIGPTILDLKSSNTDGKVTTDRSVIGLTYGFFGVIGYNGFNAGLSLGWDSGLNEDGRAWIYNGKSWIGIVIALDIIK